MLVLISSLKLSTTLCSWSRKLRSLEDSMDHGYISMSNCFPNFIVSWILNFVDQPTHENHENWYPTNKGDFTVPYFVSKSKKKIAVEFTRRI
jgi:hypothetical protein